MRFIFSSSLIMVLGLFSTTLFATPRVLVTLKPIHALAASIMEGIASPSLLLPDYASPHTFQLKPSSLKQLQEADLIIWVGPSLEHFLEKSLTAFPPSKVITLETQPDLKKLPQRHGRTWQNHTDHHHEHSAWDPHIWLSTENAKIIALHLAKKFAQQDPMHAKQYQENVERLIQSITRLQENLTALLAPVHTRPFLVYHDGYQYFEKEFDLHAVGTVLTNPHLPLSVNGLKQVQQLIQTHGIQCVFQETEFNAPRMTKTLTDLGVRVDELDPLGARIPPGPDVYEKILWQLGKNVRHCLDPTF